MCLSVDLEGLEGHMCKPHMRCAAAACGSMRKMQPAAARQPAALAQWFSGRPSSATWQASGLAAVAHLGCRMEGTRRHAV